MSHAPLSSGIGLFWLPSEKLHSLDWEEADVPVLASYLAQIKAEIQ
jgi:8-oxo-dGTP diphosphatase